MSQVTPTQRLQGADAVLAVRTKVSQVTSPRHTQLRMQSALLATPLQPNFFTLTCELHGVLALAVLVCSRSASLLAVAM